MQAAPPTQQITAGNDEIMFKDVQKATINGFLGIFIHILVVPFIFLLTFGTYAMGGLIIIGILLPLR